MSGILRAMNCPKCKSRMESIAVGSVEVDRCTVCRGTFFDGGEAERLRKVDGSEKLDVGDSDMGAAQNTNDRIRCPRDRSQMVRIVDPQQPHLWLETCPVCQGTFFDAGEFRDWKHETWMDVVRGWFAKARD